MADLDNLEYYIKFPSPNFNYNQQTGEQDYVFVVNEDKIPVILLFGWAGCQDRYLSKYSQIYEEKGWVKNSPAGISNYNEFNKHLPKMWRSVIA